MLKEEKRNLERLSRNFESRIQSLINDIDTGKKEKQNLSDEINRVSTRIEDLEREKRYLQEDSDTLRKHHSENLNEALRDHSNK